MVIIISIERKRERRNGAVPGEERYKRRRNLYFIRVGLVFICRSADFNVWRRSPTLAFSPSLSLLLENEGEWARGGWEILYYVVLLTAVSSGYFLRGVHKIEGHVRYIVRSSEFDGCDWVGLRDSTVVIIGRMSCITGRVGTRCGINALKANMRERGCVEVKECGLYVRSASCCCFFYFFLGMRINNEIMDFFFHTSSIQN
jgi:hypothetical protein